MQPSGGGEHANDPGLFHKIKMCASRRPAVGSSKWLGVANWKFGGHILLKLLHVRGRIIAKAGIPRNPVMLEGTE